MIYELTKDGEVKFTGTENGCYLKLQGLQSQSADWAMRHEGWKIEPVGPDQEREKPSVGDIVRQVRKIGSL